MIEDLLGRRAAPTVVLHRAGNHPGRVAALEQGAARWVEADVHPCRGRLELRHEKQLWPAGPLWDRWYLRSRAAGRVPELRDLLAVAPGPGLHLDLKGFGPAFARAVRAAVPAERPLLVTSRRWYLLEPFRDRADTVLGLSANSPLEIRALLRRRRPGRGAAEVGVVNARLLDARLAHEVTERYDGLLVWNAAGRDPAALARLGVSAVISDEW